MRLVNRKRGNRQRLIQSFIALPLGAVLFPIFVPPAAAGGASPEFRRGDQHLRGWSRFSRYLRPILQRHPLQHPFRWIPYIVYSDCDR